MFRLTPDQHHRLDVATEDDGKQTTTKHSCSANLYQSHRFCCDSCAIYKGLTYLLTAPRTMVTPSELL